MSFSLLVSDLKDSLDEILEASQELSMIIKSKNVRLPDSADEHSVSKSLQDYWYQTGCDGRETSFYCAVVQCSNSTYGKVLALNTLKDEFHSIYQELATFAGKEVEQSLYGICNSGTIRSRLSRASLPRIHVKQVYRKLPAFSGDISRIQYSHSNNSKSIVKISIKEAESRLIDLNPNTPDHIQVQLEKLRNHNANIGLVVVRPHPPTAKANVFFDGVRTPKTIKPRVPIYVNSDIEFDVSFFSSKYNRQPVARSDSTIEAEPFLPSIHVYRKAK
ncbi:hypothetical protein LMH73_007540 [Vibrio splendidus]|nr:hypothetical protein [Vibrio splendidus]MCC4880382.1 hypothetical protein [Vibrio splendidus]